MVAVFDRNIYRHFERINQNIYDRIVCVLSHFSKKVCQTSFVKRFDHFNVFCGNVIETLF